MSKDTHAGLLLLAAVVDGMRETLRPMVAGFVADGFTEEQARAIVAGFYASLLKKPEENQT